MKKSELRQLIRELIEEQVSKSKFPKKPLKTLKDIPSKDIPSKDSEPDTDTTKKQNVDYDEWLIQQMIDRGFDTPPPSTPNPGMSDGCGVPYEPGAFGYEEGYGKCYMTSGEGPSSPQYPYYYIYGQEGNQWAPQSLGVINDSEDLFNLCNGPIYDQGNIPTETSICNHLEISCCECPEGAECVSTEQGQYIGSGTGIAGTGTFNPPDMDFGDGWTGGGSTITGQLCNCGDPGCVYGCS